jgi:hypothetical protein
MKKSTIYITLATVLIFTCFYTCTWVFKSPWLTVLMLLVLNLSTYLARKGRQLYNIETGKQKNLYVITGRYRWLLPIMANALGLVAIIVAFT